MPSSVDLGDKLERVVAKLISQGRYGSKSEVIREGVRLVEERERKVEALDKASPMGSVKRNAPGRKPPKRR